jgi:hypothetical protein
MTSEVSRRVAYCHPESVSINADWLKNLVLFFDEICILLPDVYRDEFFSRLDWLATPLINDGILHLLRPEDVVDRAVSDSMAKIGSTLIDMGAFGLQQKDIPINVRPMTAIGELAASLREDYEVDVRLINRRLERPILVEKRATSLVERLTEAHLLRPSGRDGESLADPFARACLLAILPLVISQHAVSPLLTQITPVTDQADVFNALSRVVDLPPFHRVGEIMQVDLNSIGINAESVPIDDMIAFRTEHRDIYSRYLRTAERIAHDLAEGSPVERALILRDREQQVEDELHELRKVTRQWGRPLTGISIALSGATWTAVHGGDPIGGTLAGLGALFAFTGHDRSEARLNYLFQVQSSYASPLGPRKSISYRNQNAQSLNRRRKKKRRKREG